MRKGILNRKQAIEIMGLELVEAVEAKNCDFTNRVQTDGDDSVEFSASVRGMDFDGDERLLVAYYYQDQEAIDSVDDLGDLSWTIEGYEVY